MKFSPETINLLKNFSAVNQSILFKPGTVISTMSSSKTILASATIDTEIEDTFGIYDLSRFLGTLSLFSDPTYEVNEKFMTIKEGKKKINYVFTEPSLIVSPPANEIKLPSVDVEFDLTAGILSEVTKSLSVLSLPELAVTGDGKTISVRALNSKNPTGDIYSVEVGETNDEFNMVFNADNLKLMADDYKVQISKERISHFKGSKIDYFVAVEENSTYAG